MQWSKVSFALTLTLLALSGSAFGQVWTQANAPITNFYWHSIVVSADGRRIAAAATFGTQPLDGPIFTSSDSGSTWISNSVSLENWSGLASSASGSNLVALVPQSGLTAASTNSGDSWRFSPAPAKLNCIASSADGSQLAAGVFNGAIYTSTNSGNNWGIAPGTSGIVWRSIASSTDGRKLVAVGQLASFPVGAIYTSTDFGNTWISNNAPNLRWVSVASSADGNVLVAAPGGFNMSSGPLCVSTNAGRDWSTNGSPVLAWTAAASSADGTKLIATALAANGNQFISNSIFMSTNLGATWVSNSTPAENWASLACSADGGLLVAGTAYGGIWISQTVPSTHLNISPRAVKLLLAWTIPSTNFVLQQSSDLISWSNLTDPPAFNFTNLQNELSISPTHQLGFYRLATP